MPNASIKDEQLYDDLREQGDSKEKAARISNAAAANGRSAAGKKGGRSGSYDSWTVLELRARAKELGITGYSGLNKSDLISELREH
jgi:Rho termination factor, N-terminal domain